jgi:hypothetical protein
MIAALRSRPSEALVPVTFSTLRTMTCRSKNDRPEVGGPGCATYIWLGIFSMRGEWPFDLGRFPRLGLRFGLTDIPVKAARRHLPIRKRSAVSTR